MKLEILIDQINDLFETKDNPLFKQQSGITVNCGRPIKRIGYAVNLTMETILRAKDKNVDLLITHHDIWDDFEDMQTDCRNQLKTFNISHYFNHLPLDDASFGTNDCFAEMLNLSNVIKILEWEDLYFGRVGVLENPVTLEDLSNTIETALEEPNRSWQFTDKPIQKVGIVCGNGKQIPCLKTALEHQCDVYITGESDLYTLQYAQYHQLNLIIASHTFMELMGLKNMMEGLSCSKALEVIEIEESRLESTSNFSYDSR